MPWYMHSSRQVTEHRISEADIPVAVISPEDREQVERLSALYGINLRYAGTAGPTVDEAADAMQAALREFANPTPPKPEEPTGLGAVVVTADGEMYVRDKTTTTVAHWKRASGGEGGKRHRYSSLPVVAVLSDGVQPLADWERELLEAPDGR